MQNKETLPFHEIIMSTLDRIHAEKAGKVDPSHVTMLELTRAIGEETRKALNELYQQGKIRVGETLNDKYIVSHRWENMPK